MRLKAIRERASSERASMNPEGVRPLGGALCNPFRVDDLIGVTFPGGRRGGLRLRGLPWAIEFNAFGVEGDLAHVDAYQKSWSDTVQRPDALLECFRSPSIAPLKPQGIC